MKALRRWLHKIGSGNTVKQAEQREHFLRSWGLGSYRKDQCPGCGDYWGLPWSRRPYAFRTQYGEIVICERCVEKGTS